MSTTSLKKAKGLATGLKKARLAVSSVVFGPRSGSNPEVTRELLAHIAFVASKPGESVEVTAIAQTIAKPLGNDHSGFYHLIWTRCSSHESKVGARVRVTMFETVTRETDTLIEGTTRTTAPGATGRVFITAV